MIITTTMKSHLKTALKNIYDCRHHKRKFVENLVAAAVSAVHNCSENCCPNRLEK